MKDIMKKWWFWLILLTIIIITSFVLIVLIGFNIINPDKNLTQLATELQNYDNNITIYQSAGKNTILINCNTKTSEEAIEKSQGIGEITGRYIEYLSVYEDIKFNFYTERGEKTTFTFDIKNQQIKEETPEMWILEESVAYKETEEKLNKLQSEKELISSEISALESKKNELNLEIEKLNEDIIKLKGEPRTYPAGHLTVGIDIPSGKYKIYGGSSNFVVYSSYGDLEVNIILGGNYGVSEYIYTFKTGEKIEARSSFKLVAVE